MHWQGVIRHYGRFFTFVPDEAVITLLEGNTPLIPAPALARRIARNPSKASASVKRPVICAFPPEILSWMTGAE